MMLLPRGFTRLEMMVATPSSLPVLFLAIHMHVKPDLSTREIKSFYHPLTLVLSLRGFQLVLIASDASCPTFDPVSRQVAYPLSPCDFTYLSTLPCYSQWLCTSTDGRGINCQQIAI